MVKINKPAKIIMAKTMAKKTTHHILLVEFEDEVRAFLDYCNREQADAALYTVVAMQPKVRLYLKSQAQSLTCLDTLKFFNNDSHRRALDKSHELARLMADELSFADSSRAPRTMLDTFIYYARFYINNYLRVLEILRGIKEQYGTDRLWIMTVSAGENGGNSRGQPFLVNEDRFLAPLAKEYCQVHGIPYKEIPGETITIPTPVKSPAAPGVLRKLAGALLKARLRRLAGEPVVFLAALSYNLDRLYHALARRFPDLRAVTAHSSAIGLGGYLKFCIKEIIRLVTGKKDRAGILSVPIDVLETGGADNARLDFTQWESAFVYDGCPLLEVFRRKVEDGLLVHLGKLDHLAAAQQEILEHLKPNVLISPVSIDTFQSWGELCRDRGIPALVIPQKGLVAPVNDFARKEEFYIGRAQVTGVFDAAAAQTPYVKDYLDWAGYKGKVLETGNLIFARLNPKAPPANIDLPDDKHIIVYAPSMKSRKSHRFYVLETLDELMAGIEDVMNAVAALPDAHLVMRIHPGEPVTRKEIEGLIDVPENVTISDTGSFEEVLSAAALTVSFSSTSIQESLINGVPVLLYDKWKRYNHLGAPVVRKGKPKGLSSSYYIDTPKNLRPAIRWILDHHAEAESPSRLFQDCVFPGRYAERFYGFIQQCLDPGNPTGGKKK
jgi:hypothetical protein